MPARLTAKCDNCGRKVEYDDNTGDWNHVFLNRENCTHAWPQGVPIPDPDEYWERIDFVRMLRSAGQRPQSTSTEVDRVNHDIERLERRLELLKMFPEEDPFDDGDVIQFTRLLGRAPGAQRYAYVAVRQNGRWYLTGKLNKTPKRWADLVKFLTDGFLVGKIWFVTGWEEMVPGENV